MGTDFRARCRQSRHECLTLLQYRFCTDNGGPLMSQRTQPAVLYCLFLFLLLPQLVLAQKQTQPHAWMNRKLSPDERAAMVVKEMTLDEKIQMLHGTGMAGLSP